jgi:hypothetical protein
MGILDFTIPTNKPAANASNQRNDRPKAKLWLNIGYESNGKFVNLPVGLPIDTMEGVKATGQNEDWIKFQSARNGLMEALQKFGSQLTPGQEVDVPNLIIRLRSVNEETVVDAATNEYAIDLSAMFKASQAQAAE